MQKYITPVPAEGATIFEGPGRSGLIAQAVGDGSASMGRRARPPARQGQMSSQIHPHGERTRGVWRSSTVRGPAQDQPESDIVGANFAQTSAITSCSRPFVQPLPLGGDLLSFALFCYGTLEYPEVMTAVTRRSFPRVRGVLEGYARFLIKGAVYPGVIAAACETTDGTLYTGVDARSLRLLISMRTDCMSAAESRCTRTMATSSSPKCTLYRKTAGGHCHSGAGIAESSKSGTCVAIYCL